MTTPATLLTAEVVEKLFELVGAVETDDMTETVQVAGVVHTFRVSRERLNESRDLVVELLRQLPDEFLKPDGGWSFLCAAERADGVQWGEHRQVEMLLVLGEALELVDCLLPRDFWPMLPGGMPYYRVALERV